MSDERIDPQDREAMEQAWDALGMRKRGLLTESYREIFDKGVQAHREYSKQREEKLLEALDALVRWVDHGLDLSDRYSVEQALPGEMVRCTRPKEIWEKGEVVMDEARAALAENGDSDE